MPLLTASRNMVGFFPDRTRTVLRWSQKRTLTATTGTPVIQQYAGNSVFDPDQGSGSTQPANFDDMALHYNRYRVYGSAIYIYSQTTTFSLEMVLYPNNTVPSASVENALAQPYSVASVSTSNGTTLRSSASTLKIIGRNPATTDALSALVSADPADIWFWTLAYNGLDAATTAVAQATVVIDYDVEFFDRVDGNLDVRLQHLRDVKAAYAQAAVKRFAREMADKKKVLQADEKAQQSSSGLAESEYALIDIEDLPRTAGGNVRLVAARRAITTPITPSMSNSRPP